MPDQEWIELFFNKAGRRLARYLGISQDEAEAIIRRVLHRRKRKIVVRSDDPADIYFPRIITDEIAATLEKNVFFSPEFPSAQVIWSELLTACLEEITSGENAQAPRDAAIAELLENGEWPPETMPWPTFCVAVRDRAGGWICKRHGKFKRGFGDRSIKRAVTKLTKPRGSHSKHR